MCRIAAWTGAEIALEDIVLRPSHSLLEQSQHADQAKLAVNGDGFGIAWYGVPRQPGLYRDVLPAWADANLVSLCQTLRSHRFIAHIRASTMGETARSNCHPFTWESWSFCHNGQIPHFPQIRRGLEAALPDALYAHRKGSTDSEMLFLTALALGLAEDPAGALAAAISKIGTHPATGPVRITCVFSDGDTLWGLRHASDGRAPTLYLSDAWLPGGHALASEPLDGRGDGWTALPPDMLVGIHSDGRMSRTDLFARAQVA